MSEHVVRRGARYYYRRRVPVELVAKLDGKTEIQRALGTSDPKEARKLARRVAVEIDTLFERTANGEALVSTPASVKIDPASLASAGEEVLYPPNESDLAPYKKGSRRQAAARSASEWLKLELSVILANAQQRPQTAPAHAIGENVREESKQPGVRLPDAFSAWVRLRQPTQATQDTMQRVMGLFRRAGGPLELAAIQRTHVTAMINTLGSSSISTQRAYLSMLKALFSAAVSVELMPVNVAANVRIEGKQKGKARIPFSLDDVHAITSNLPATGAARWIPLVALYTGARLNEIGQLRREDIKQETYKDAHGESHKIPVLYITDESDEQRLKNESSRRRVPMHSELVALGFMDYVSAQTGPLFPELKADKTGRLTARFGQSFGKALRTTYGVADPRKTFHSFRHLFKDILREHGVAKSVNDALTGHASGDTADAYGGEFYPLRPLVEAMDKYHVHGVKI